MPSVSSEDLARIINYFGPIHNAIINTLENLRLEKLSLTTFKFHNCFDNETLFIYQKPQLEGGSINQKLFKEYQFLFYGICDLAMSMSTKKISPFPENKKLSDFDSSTIRFVCAHKDVFEEVIRHHKDLYLDLIDQYENLMLFFDNDFIDLKFSGGKLFAINRNREEIDASSFFPEDEYFNSQDYFDKKSLEELGKRIQTWHNSIDLTSFQKDDDPVGASDKRLTLEQKELPELKRSSTSNTTLEPRAQKVSVLSTKASAHDNS